MGRVGPRGVWGGGCRPAVLCSFIQTMQPLTGFKQGWHDRICNLKGPFGCGGKNRLSTSQLAVS